MFNDNGQCGYILKPEILRNPSLGFNPSDSKTMKNIQRLTIKIISAQQLPAPPRNGIVTDIIDPYVIISTYGVSFDRHEEKTKVIKDNGFNPRWDETFEFTICCPELAFVRFKVKDEDLSQDDFIGEYTIRYENMRQGKTDVLFYFIFFKLKLFFFLEDIAT